MRIQCDACGKAEATIICCADEAVLCSNCDKRVHEANKVAGKHHRLPLTSSRLECPRCDICQDKIAYFFCMQDRALLCQSCDLAIHRASALSASHLRFLVTGTKLAADANDPDEGAGADVSEIPSTSVAEAQTSSKPVPLIATPESEAVPSWLFDDLAGCYHLKDTSIGSSKTDDCEWSPELNIFNSDSEMEDVQVPQTPSPPTSSGLSKSKRIGGTRKAKAMDLDDCFIVPDIGLQSQPSSPVRKRKYLEFDFPS